MSEVVQRAEREVIEAAKSLVTELENRKSLTPAEQRLKMAVFMLTKATSISGEYRFILPRKK